MRSGSADVRTELRQDTPGMGSSADRRQPAQWLTDSELVGQT